MTGGWLGWLDNVSPLLLLMPLVLLVASFLVDSLRTSEPAMPDNVKTRKSVINGALWDVFLVGLWGYVLVGELRKADGSRIFIVILSIAMILTTFHIIRSLVEAYKLGSEETASPST